MASPADSSRDPAAAPPPADRPLQGMSVLIAEDSWHIADAMRQTVEEAGARIAGVAGNLADAERMAAAETFDTALMDLNLHGKMANGLAERLAAAGVKVVVLTGYERPKALAAKVHDCLTKPVPSELLIEALARPLRR